MAKIIISSTLTRHYGPFAKTFGLSHEIEVKNAAEILVEQNKLDDVIDILFRDWEAHRLPKQEEPKKQLAKGIEGDTKPEKPIWYKAKEIYMSLQDGKKYWYVRPSEGPWKKYGAAVYFDRMNGITEEEAREMVDPETFTATLGGDYRVLVEMYKGKPRAIRLAQKDEIEA